MVQDAATLRSPGWVAMPEDDDEEALEVAAHATEISATTWYMVANAAMLAAMLLMGETLRAPWWLIAIVAAETYASFRRRLTYDSKSSGCGRRKPHVSRQRRLRHFTSLRLAAGAPVDEIIARWLALDELRSVSGHTQSNFLAPIPHMMCRRTASLLYVCT